MPDSQRIYHLSVRFLSKLYFLGDVKETAEKRFLHCNLFCLIAKIKCMNSFIKYFFNTVQYILNKLIINIKYQVNDSNHFFSLLLV